MSDLLMRGRVLRMLAAACGRYFHGYPWPIHRLTYRGTNRENLPVRGCNEEGRFPSKLLSAMRYEFGGHLEKLAK